MKKISLVVPVYNVQPFLKRCVDSILNQTYKKYRMVIVDDGSLDNCGEYCDKYAKNDKRIIVIHKKNGGLSDARNIGIDWTQFCSGCQWISFIDSDDFVHPDYLRLLYDAIMLTGNKLSICGYMRTEKNEIPYLDNSMNVTEYDVEDFFCNMNTNAVVAWGKLYRVDDFSDIRYPVGRIHEDSFTTHRILFKYRKISYINTPLYMYFVNQSSITQNPWTSQRMDAENAYIQQIDYFKKNNYSRALYSTALFLSKFYFALLYNNSFPNEQKKEIAHKLRRIIKKYQIDIKKDYTYYNYAYPKLMFIFWQIKRFLNK